MCCNKLFPSLNSMYLGDKLKVPWVKLGLQKKHLKMILRQHCPSFYRRVFGKVDSMKSFLSNTNQQRFQKHRNCLNKFKNYMNLSKIVIPKYTQECWEYRGIHCLSISRSFHFPCNMMNSSYVAKESKRLIQHGIRRKLECKWKHVGFGLKIWLSIPTYILGILLHLSTCRA